jgi:hypothetical protein
MESLYAVSMFNAIGISRTAPISEVAFNCLMLRAISSPPTGGSRGAPAPELSRMADTEFPEMPLSGSVASERLALTFRTLQLVSDACGLSTSNRFGSQKGALDYHRRRYRIPIDATHERWWLRNHGARTAGVGRAMGEPPAVVIARRASPRRAVFDRGLVRVGPAHRSMASQPLFRRFSTQRQRLDRRIAPVSDALAARAWPRSRDHARAGAALVGCDGKRARRSSRKCATLPIFRISSS